MEAVGPRRSPGGGHEQGWPSADLYWPAACRACSSACGRVFDELTLACTAALETVNLRQRLTAFGDIDTSTQLFGQKLAMPFMLAPIGMAGMLARRGEAVRAARSQVLFIMSTASVCAIDEVSATGIPSGSSSTWPRTGFRYDLLARAKEAGCPVLVMTSRSPLPGPRYRDQRSGLSGPAGLWGSGYAGASNT